MSNISRFFLLPAIVSLVLVPGCLEKGVSTHSAPQSPLEIPVQGSKTEWTDCHGIGILLYAPTAIYEGHRPPSWGPGELPYNPIQLKVHQCARISWGPFERGPVYVLHEWHVNYLAPESCEQHAENVRASRMMESIWFGDRDLAKYAKDVYGMPAHFANFSFTESPPTGALVEKTWSWISENGSKSHITYYDTTQHQDGLADFADRLYWQNGQGVSYMDYVYSLNTNQQSSFTSRGELPAPMMWGSYGPTPSFQAAAASGAESDVSARGEISRFGDETCETPL